MERSLLDLAIRVLEQLEMRSLSWGFIDQSLGEVEARDCIATALQGVSDAESSDDVLDALCNERLVRMFTEDGERRYRTRFAELVRLLSRLRQWFPGQPWQAAPTLVSDFRVDTRQRQYPRRQITPQDAWTRLTGEHRLSELQRSIWLALTTRDTQFALADFQVDAARRLLGMRRGTATIVTAGTSSGKTLAFYLPAIVGLAPMLQPGGWWTKSVCLYPRQELLKDQFSEAYQLALRTADLLRKEGRRPIVLGTLFGPTPTYANEDALKQANWRQLREGFICPFLRCPLCGSDMLWARQAIAAGEEVLRCTAHDCGTYADSETLRLTRRSLQAKPADFLFTTTEMMNQRLSDTRYRRLFGVTEDASRLPVFALVDEAHTYAGVSGAQTALLLRRWLSLLGDRPCWAGLSATLPHAERFFGDLTGTRPHRVVRIAPAPTEMISEGGEYNIILRSDASSQVSALSTTIQGVMLLGRMLDSANNPVSDGRFGSRVFVFTDDLDVTNRLYDNLLDAEAYDRWRRIDNSRAPLAALRGTTQPNAAARELDGQRWEMAEDLQTSLANRLRIGRTTSRDPGVTAEADVIVATSTLEVGFNDPDVGAILQHKAPRSAASFLQRRGRAGRPREMRPITVVVLSDYGRDRVAFQSYETLFEPTVETESLPIQNLYVLRIQAVYAIFEWIAAQAPPGVDGWAWRVFSGPTDGRSPFQDHARDMLQKLVRMEPDSISRLRHHLKLALGISDSVLETVLWEPPRAVLLEALPTLARRLFRQWMLSAGNGLDFHVDSPPHPLPDFVPANLFSELNLPEVQLHVPGVAEPESLPIVQALQQFAPGRVQRRFADWQGKISHWIPVNVSMPAQQLTISQYAMRHEYVGTRDGIGIFRPWELQLAAVPLSVQETSNARWNWQTRFEALGSPTHISLPRLTGLENVGDRLEFHLHRLGSAISVCRFAHDGEAALRVNRQDQRIAFQLVDDQQKPAAVGFTFEADALIFAFRLPPSADLLALRVSPAISAWWKYLAIAHYVELEVVLRANLNSFRREWLFQVVLLAALQIAERDRVSLEDALARLRASTNGTVFIPAIEALVAGVHFWPDDDDNAAPRPAPRTSTQLSATLAQLLLDPVIVRSLVDLILRWIHPSDVDWGEWLATLARATLGEGIHQACITVAPRSAAAEGLTVDVDRTPQGDRVVIAETTLGGGGTVEALAESFAADPRSFVRALESACSASDQEMAADTLERVVHRVNTDGTLAAALARLRTAADTETREAARHEFFRLLAEQGLPVFRTLSILIATRLVRPGATPQSDRVTLDLLAAWNRLETTHGIALPSRLAAPAIILTTRLPNLTALSGQGREIELASLLLWPKGGELRQRAFQSYNPFRSAPLVDAALTRLLLFERRLPIVFLEAPGWEAQAMGALAAHGIVRLVTSQADPSWRAAVAQMLAQPVVSGFLQFYPMIEAARLIDGARFAIDLALRDRV